MSEPARRRIGVEAISALISAVLVASTLLRPDWIEWAFGFEPDGGDGTLEWAIVVVFAMVAIGSTFLASARWRRGGPQPGLT